MILTKLAVINLLIYPDLELKTELYIKPVIFFYTNVRISTRLYIYILLYFRYVVI